MTNDVLDRLTRENPVRFDEAAPDVELLRAIVAEPVRHPRRGLFVAAMGAAALAALAIALLLPDDRLGPSPAAAQALERLAIAAAAQPEAPPDRWSYSRVRTLYGATNIDGERPYTVLLPALRESWIAPSGEARIRETPNAPIFLNESDRRRWRDSGGRMTSAPTREQRYRKLPLSEAFYADVAGLPTDPAALEAELRRKVEAENPPPEDGYSVDGELGSIVSSLLHSPASSGELRAAAYRVLARQPWVELVGDVVDPAGRRGIGLRHRGGYGEEDEPTSRLLIVDPKTGNVLAEQTIVERRVDWIDADPGDVIGEIVYVEQGWVSSDEERP